MQLDGGWQVNCGNIFASRTGAFALLQAFTAVLAEVARKHVAASGQPSTTPDTQAGKGGGR
ncbi:hypothetical protein [Myxococcus sp. Y35]|uniref:hypothetical protein n=1 Tax=Pseudomyxococcus flavus TaxID=3115648 RepID=UPI003CE75423